MPSLLYVIVKNGTNYGIGQFAITDVSKNGDGISSSFEQKFANINPTDQGNPQAAMTDLFEQFNAAEGGAVPEGGKVYYAFQNLDNGFVVRGKSNSDGSITGVFLAPNAHIRELILDPRTLDTGSTSFTTPTSGASYNVGTSIELRPSQYPDSFGDGLSDDATFILGITPQQLATSLHGINIGADSRKDWTR